jgi:hypothetical protein
MKKNEAKLDVQGFVHVPPTFILIFWLGPIIHAFADGSILPESVRPGQFAGSRLL